MTTPRSRPRLVANSTPWLPPIDPAKLRLASGKLSPVVCALVAAQGYSLRTIGKAAGVSGERIRQVLLKAGFAADLGSEVRRRRLAAERPPPPEIPTLPEVETLWDWCAAARFQVTEKRRRGFTLNGIRLVIHRGHRVKLGHRTYRRVMAQAQDSVHVLLLDAETFVFLAPRPTTYVIPLDPIRVTPRRWPRLRVARAAGPRAFYLAAKTIRRQSRATHG